MISRHFSTALNALHLPVVIVLLCMSGTIASPAEEASLPGNHENPLEHVGAKNAAWRHGRTDVPVAGWFGALGAMVLLMRALRRR